MNEPLHFSSKLRDYPVDVRDDGWAAELAAQKGVVAVVDENVWRLHRDGVLAGIDDPILLPIDEEHKTFATVAWLCDRLLERRFQRAGTVLSIGGGITQDVSGYAASTLYRGVRWLFAPTTLLAQADSCVGGKTSLNFGAYKNILGTMYPPHGIVIDPRFLATLSRDDFFSGLGEVVKLHVLGGPEHARHLENVMGSLTSRKGGAVADSVDASLRIKKPYIEEDEFDRGRRNMLNFGHCFGHALEAATDFAVSHGQGVVLGMLLAGVVAGRRGLLGDALQKELEERLFLPVLVSRPQLDESRRERVIEAMRHDKKRSGEGLALVMCCDGFEMRQVNDLTEAEALAALDGLWRR
jgi:3-dehydroquinate synthase